MKKTIIASAIALAAMTGFASMASAQVAGTAGAACGNYDVTTGTGARSEGSVCLPGHLYIYRNGEGNRVMVFPSNNQFQFNGSGANPRMSCVYRNSGNSIGGGGYLAAGRGSRLDCVATVGNGGHARSQDITLQFRNQ